MKTVLSVCVFKFCYSFDVPLHWLSIVFDFYVIGLTVTTRPTTQIIKDTLEYILLMAPTDLYPFSLANHYRNRGFSLP